MSALENLALEVSGCRRCPRLVQYREAVAQTKKKSFQKETYWGRPVPGFGDLSARVLILGLAPAAHGANRTGRMFTGDGERGAGDFLMRALHRAGFASQPHSSHINDGLELKDVYLTVIARCAPPDNKPTAVEIKNCRPFLLKEFSALRNLEVVLALGQLAFREFLNQVAESGEAVPNPAPRFAHGAVFQLGSWPTLIASYHPSRQNTQTGLLTEKMFQEVIEQAKKCAEQQ